MKEKMQNERNDMEWKKSNLLLFSISSNLSPHCRQLPGFFSLHIDDITIQFYIVSPFCSSLMKIHQTNDNHCIEFQRHTFHITNFTHSLTRPTPLRKVLIWCWCSLHFWSVNEDEPIFQLNNNGRKIRIPGWSFCLLANFAVWMFNKIGP